MWSDLIVALSVSEGSHEMLPCAQHDKTVTHRLEATVQDLTERLQQDSRSSVRTPLIEPPQVLGKRSRREPSGPLVWRATRPCGADAGVGPGRRAGGRGAGRWPRAACRVSGRDGVAGTAAAGLAVDGRSHDYLTVACQAALCGESAPFLLPIPDNLEQLMPLAA